MAFLRGHDVRLAVERAAGGAEDDLAHAVVDRGLQHVEAADHVDQRVVSGIGHRLRHLRLGGVVVDDDGLERSDRAFHLGEVADVGTVEMRRRIDVVLAARGQIVKDGDLVAGGHVGVHHMGADESRAASDENLHRP